MTDLPANSGVVISRDADHLTLRFSTSLVFDPDSSSLKPDGKSALPLSAALRLMKRRRMLSAQVSVYTDTLGDDSANQSFSAARAKALCSALVAGGLSAARLHQRAAGASEALSSNATPEGRIENRRVEIAFTRTGQ